MGCSPRAGLSATTALLASASGFWASTVVMALNKAQTAFLLPAARRVSAEWGAKQGRAFSFRQSRGTTTALSACRATVT